MVLAWLLIAVVDVPIRDALAALFSGVISCCCCLFVDVSCRRGVWRLIVCLHAHKQGRSRFKNPRHSAMTIYIYITLLFKTVTFRAVAAVVETTFCGRVEGEHGN